MPSEVLRVEDNRIGERLYALRIRQGRSAKAVSELCGLSGDLVRQYELGIHKPAREALLAWADYYDVSVDSQLCRTDRPGGGKILTG